MTVFQQWEPEARERAAEDNVRESESLTADLPDDAARYLLDWGASQARRLAQVAGGEDQQAQAVLDEQLAVLRRLLRSLSALAADERPLEAERLMQRLDRLREAAGKLGLPWNPAVARPPDPAQPPSDRILHWLSLFAPTEDLDTLPERNGNA